MIICQTIPILCSESRKIFDLILSFFFIRLILSILLILKILLYFDSFCLHHDYNCMITPANELTP